MKLLIISLFVILVFANIPKFISVTQNTLWNVYYERQARETFYNAHVPEWDNLSYLGRKMTYPPGYFTLKATFLWLLSLNYDLIGDIVFELFSNIAFVISLVFLTGKLKLRMVNRLLVILFFSSSLFVFTLLSAHLLHVSSLALLFFSLGFAIDKNDSKKQILSGILLGASALIHPFSLFLFIIFFLGILSTFKIDSFNAEMLLLPLIIALIIYLPILLNLSLPRAALPEEWGWLLSGGLRLSDEFVLLIPIIVCSLFIGFLRKETRLLSALVLFFLLFYSLISFRVNIIISFLSALLVARLIENKKTAMLLLIIIFLNFASSVFILCYTDNLGSYLSKETFMAINSLLNTSEEEIIADPIFGHAITFIAQKKVLADLYVEYADEEKLRDAIEFGLTGNLSIARKWGINLAFTTHDCKDWNRIYDNGYYRVCES